MALLCWAPRTGWAPALVARGLVFGGGAPVGYSTQLNREVGVPRNTAATFAYLPSCLVDKPGAIRTSWEGGVSWGLHLRYWATWQLPDGCSMDLPSTPQSPSQFTRKTLCWEGFAGFQWWCLVLSLSVWCWVAWGEGSSLTTFHGKSRGPGCLYCCSALYPGQTQDVCLCTGKPDKWN